MYKQPLTLVLYGINDDADPNSEPSNDANADDADTLVDTHSQVLVVDVVSSLVSAEYSFIDSRISQ